MKSEKTKSIIKQIISLFISICIIGQSASTFAMQTPKQQREEFIEYLQEEQGRYKKLFDQESLLEELDYDTDRIIDFVTKKIVYQAYEGVLRGAKGTLIGRAGNSHDQAITLAGMLNDAGLEAEIVVGKLTAEQARELNLTIKSPQFTQLKNSSNPLIAKHMINKAEGEEKASEEDISILMKKTDAIAERILKHLPPEKLNQGVQVYKDNVQNSALSYRWVRYRLAQGKGWIDVHPAYEDANKWNLIPVSVEKNSVNIDDLQQVSVEVWIENSEGEKHSITGLWKKPAANLLDHTLSIEFSSDAVIKSNLRDDPELVLKQSHFFFAKVDGKLPNKGKVFDLSGNLYSADSLTGLNSVFSTLNKQTQKATDALSSLSFNRKLKVNSKKQLTKVWLEFTLNKPNAESKNIKRVIFDGNALSETSKAPLRLLQRWDIGFTTTVPMQQHYQFKKSKQIIEALEIEQKLQSLLSKNPEMNEKSFLEKYSSIKSSPAEVYLTYKRNIFDLYNSKDKVVSYINQPNILAIRTGLNLSSKNWRSYEMTDIISNNRLSFLRSKDVLLPSYKTSIKHGVWETRTEVERVTNKNNVVYSNSAFKALNETKNYILNSKSNHIALSTDNAKSWWSIDILTGNTIGMIETDQGIGGADIKEYLTLTSFVISFLLHKVGIYNCLNGPRSQFLCCVLLNEASFIAGIVVGYYAAFQLVASISFDYVSMKASNFACGSN